MSGITYVKDHPIFVPKPIFYLKEKYIKDKVIFQFMSENIKILEKDKNIFGMVQDELTLKTGKKITQQESFSQLIEFVMSRKDNFLSRLSKLPLSEKENKKIRSIPRDMGVNTNGEDIDMIVYGAKKSMENFC